MCIWVRWVKGIYLLLYKARSHFVSLKPCQVFEFSSLSLQTLISQKFQCGLNSCIHKGIKTTRPLTTFLTFFLQILYICIAHISSVHKYVVLLEPKPNGLYLINPYPPQLKKKKKQGRAILPSLYTSYCEIYIAKQEAETNQSFPL